MILELTPINYQQITSLRSSPPEDPISMLDRYSGDRNYERLYVNLEPYVNQSSLCVSAKFSLHRTYIIFRTLGLRHLCIINDNNYVVGIITRKDLMGFKMEEKLGERINEIFPFERPVELSQLPSSLSQLASDEEQGEFHSCLDVRA